MKRFMVTSDVARKVALAGHKVYFQKEMQNREVSYDEIIELINTDNHLDDKSSFEIPDNIKLLSNELYKNFNKFVDCAFEGFKIVIGIDKNNELYVATISNGTKDTDAILYIDSKNFIEDEENSIESINEWFNDFYIDEIISRVDGYTELPENWIAA